MPNPQLSTVYDKSFFDDLTAGSGESAAICSSTVYNLLKPESVADIGCGRGEWLAAFKKLGVTNVLGLDGTDLPPEDLAINPSEYRIADLTAKQSFANDFDLTISLEVAEHLPESSAEHFVSMLTSLSPAVLFSAAIPGQGGVHHINEQWPAYWAKLFDQHNYGFCDVLRLPFWDDTRVKPWYAQNMLVYLDRSQAHRWPGLESKLSVPGETPRAMVHPEIFELRVTEAAKYRRRLDRLKPWKMITKKSTTREGRA